MYPRLRDLREDNDMTQAALAKMLGMSQTGYSKYETGENDVPTQILIRLADFYGTSVIIFSAALTNDKTTASAVAFLLM